MPDMRAYLCAVCEGEADWSITRVGDAAASWACYDDLSEVLMGLKRRGEVTEFVVKASAFGAMVAIEEALDAVRPTPTEGSPEE